MSRTRLCWLVVAAIPLIQPMQAIAQEVKAKEDETITISGFILGSVFVNNRIFGPGNGQSSMWVDVPKLTHHRYYNGADVQGTRLTLDYNGPKVSRNWRVHAGLEIDFFGNLTGVGAFSHEQPNPRLRLAYADLTNGRTTIRIGQYWIPVLGIFAESNLHAAFPLGWGSAGIIGWRMPGIFFYQDLGPRDKTTKVQLQLAAFEGSWQPNTVDDINAGQSGLTPQLEAKLDLSQAKSRVPWQAYLAAHWDRKFRSGPGTDSIATDGYFNGWAVTLGGKVQPGHWTFLINSFGGRAVGQLFAQILQFGEFSGWGIQGQAGYDFNEHWGLWAFYGFGREADAPFRTKNEIISPMLRYTLKQYSLSFEWYRAITDHRPEQGPLDQFSGDQLALTMRYNF